MKKKYIAITLGIMCFILVFSIMIQLNTIKDATSTAGKRDTENRLRDQVLRWKELYDRTYLNLEDVEKILAEERKTSTSTDTYSIEKQKRLNELNAYLGMTDVIGSGIIITIQDNTSSKLVTALDLIHDGDLRAIVSEAKNIGADAISINGQRIVPSTVITCAGAVVQINGEAIGAPFVIEIIGSDYLEYNIQRPGSWIDSMKRDGLNIDIRKEDNITIEKYNGVLTNKYTKNAE